MSNAIFCADIKAKLTKFSIVTAIILFVFYFLWSPKYNSFYNTFGVYNNFGVRVRYWDGYDIGGIKPIGLIYVIFLVLAIFVLIYSLLVIKMSKECRLELHEKEIYGYVKRGFSSKSVRLPLDKVDNMMISESITDKMYSGKTIVICSASAAIKFPWVQNADEFVSNVLKAIDEYNKTNDFLNNHD